MNDIKLKNNVISYLSRKAKQSRSDREFTAKEITDTVGGYPPRIGIVADDVVTELRGRGIDIKYVRTGNRRKFVIKYNKGG